jgi:Na+/proline symporter
MHWRRATTAGGIGGMVAGFFTVVAWHVGTELTEVIPQALAASIGDPVVPGILVSFVVLVGLSLATAPPSDRSTEPFFPEAE